MRRKLSWIPVLCLVGCVLGSCLAAGQLSGYFGLDIIGRRIPTTLTGELQLDTPSEFAMLEFGLVSTLDATAIFQCYKLGIDLTVNMAGPEHLVLDSDFSFDSVDVYGMMFDKLSIVPEVWFAVPFEAVTDVNGLPNSVVIPPGDPLFVTGRLTTSWQIGGFKVKHLLMLQDVEFPKPGSAFEPLTYSIQSQSFDMGTLINVSWVARMGFTVTSVTGINASQASTAVKGHSAVGSVDPGEFFQNISVGGISLCGLGFGGIPLISPQIGFGMSYSSKSDLSASVSFGAGLTENSSISTSMTIIGGPVQLGAISLSGSFGPFRFAFSIDDVKLNSLSANLSMPLNMGALTGRFSTSLTGLERGLTGLTTSLSVGHGMLTASTSMSYAERGGDFGFASLSTQISFRMSPGLLSFQATFGRFGLTRAALSVGVAF